MTNDGIQNILSKKSEKDFIPIVEKTGRFSGYVMCPQY